MDQENKVNKIIIILTSGTGKETFKLSYKVDQSQYAELSLRFQVTG